MCHCRWISSSRRRCYDYETAHGVDLYKDCITDLADPLAKLMNIDGRIRRMDSTMIEANIRRLSRMELLYTCIAKLVRYLAVELIPTDLSGQDTAPIMADFEMSEDGKRVLKCPGGHEPRTCSEQASSLEERSQGQAHMKNDVEFCHSLLKSCPNFCYDSITGISGV